MDTHGVFLRLAGRRCVVVGGDQLAADKAAACAAAGAEVTLICAAPEPAARALVESGRVTHRARAFEPGDFAGATLAYARTGDPDLIERLRAEARERGVLLNVLDVPDACDFFSGAVVARGPVRILIGTGGAAPAVAAVVRERIAAAIGPEYGTLAQILGALRSRLQDRPDRAACLRRLARSDLVERLRAGDGPGAERIIRDVTGAALSLATLGTGSVEDETEGG